MCRGEFDFDNDFNDIVWEIAEHPELPTPFRIACCPDCKKPMVFTEPDGKEFCYIRIEWQYYKLWITSNSHKNISQTFIQ